MNTKINPARRMVIILCLIMLFFSIVSLACSDGIEVAGDQAVNKVLFETSKAEQAIQQAVDDSCDTRLQYCDPIMR